MPTPTFLDQLAFTEKALTNEDISIESIKSALQIRGYRVMTFMEWQYEQDGLEMLLRQIPKTKQDYWP